MGNMLLRLCVSWLVLCGAESRHWSGFRKVFNKFDYEAPPSSPPSYNTLYFHQQLDHFNYVNTAVWKQKYLSSEVYWQGKGPLFFYTGNEGPIESFYSNTGFLFTLAQEFNAMIVFAEHRYYGDSLPFGDDSFAKANLGYLSVEQALADFAVLIRAVRKQYPAISNVITFGGSYGGMLSAWLRMKYPNVVAGALAASAPIFYINGDVPQTAFYRKVTEDFAAADSRCPKYVREGYSMIDQLVAEGDTGLSQLTQYFSLCDPLTKDKVEHLKGWVQNSFTSLAMVDYPYPANFLAPLPAYPVKTSCQLITSAKNRLVGLAQGAGLFYNGTTGSLSCFNITSEFVECSDSTGCGTGPAAISWDYQACTEMMLPSDTNNVTDMFPPHTFDPASRCMERYGVQYRTDWMDTQYWDSDLRSASNIIFSNGNLDPWSVGGVTPRSVVPDSVIPILIEGGAHHLDLRFADDKDPPSVIIAREKEKAAIQRWLKS